MNASDDRFRLSAEQYLEKHHILVYIEDAIAQLLEHKEENPKVITAKFFSDYFRSLREGKHTLFREYSFIHATPHNRSSFVKTFWKCFQHIGKKGDLLSIREYHSLLCLLCHDFPFEPVQKTARIILMEDAMDCLISFTDFLYAFQAQFFYEEFLEKCMDVYKSLLNSTSPRETVVVPSSEPTQSSIHQTAQTHSSTDGVDSTQFYKALINNCTKSDYSCPPFPVLKDILSAAPRVTFYGFLMAIVKSEQINTSIGKLPSKSELLDTTEEDSVSPRSIEPSTATKLNHPASASSVPISGGSDGQTQVTDNKPPAPPKTAPAGATRKKKVIKSNVISDQSGTSESSDDDSGDTDSSSN